MLYNDIIKAVGGTFYHQAPGWEEEIIGHVVAGDLMSDVLTVEEDDLLMITSLATDQVVRTADFVGARAVLLVNGKKPSESLVALARESNISVLCTDVKMFTACHALGTIL